MWVIRFMHGATELICTSYKAYMNKCALQQFISEKDPPDFKKKMDLEREKRVSER